MNKETLTDREKALAYTGASVVSGCMPCTQFHIEKCKSLGIPENEIEEAILQSTHVATSALNHMKAYGLKQLQVDLNNQRNTQNPQEEPNKIGVIVSLTAAYVAGNTHEFRHYLKLGEKFDLTIDDLLTLTDIAWIIKEKAQEHLDKLFDKGEHVPVTSCC